MANSSLWHRDIFHPAFRNAPPRSHLRRQHHLHHQHHHQMHREAGYALDAIEDAEYTSEADLIDHYYIDDENVLDDRFYHAFRAMPEPVPVLKPALRNVKVRIPEQAFEAMGVRDDDVLILPAGLVRMKVHMRCGGAKETLQASVAGEMRLREVLKQVVPANHAGEVRALFKVRGEWEKFDGGMKVGQLSDMNRRVLDEKPEVEVRIELAGGGGGGMRNMRGYEWEHVWGMRG